MAATRKRKPGRPPQALKNGQEVVRSLWKIRGPRQWFDFLMFIAPEHKWTLSNDGIKGKCPYHDDNTPSFTLYFSRGYAKCFGCDTFRNDLVDVVQRLRGGSYLEAFLHIQQYFKLETELGEIAERLAEHNELQEVKKHTVTAMKEVVNEYVRDNPPHLSYLTPAFMHLTKGRGINQDFLIHLPVNIYAKPEHVKKYIPSQFHKGYDNYFTAKYQKAHHWGALLFHYNDSPRTITRFKLRCVDSDALRKVSERHKDLRNINTEEARSLFDRKHIEWVEDPATSECGLYGLHAYQHHIGKNVDPNVYITEGEFDVLTTMAAQLEKDSPDFAILGTSGSGSQSVGFMHDYGIRTIFLVPDHPTANGDEYVRGFLKTNSSSAVASTDGSFNIKIFSWPNRIYGKDLDDVIRKEGYNTIRELFVRENKACFLNANVWVEARCDREIQDLRDSERQQIMEAEKEASEVEEGTTPRDCSVQVKNIKDATRTSIRDTILTWLEYLQDPTAKLAMAQKYASKEGIDVSADRAINSAIYALDSREGVIRKIKDALSDFFCLAYYERSGKNYIVNLWSKRKCELVALPANATIQLTETLISQFVGQDAVTWVEGLLKGSPAWEVESGEGKDSLTAVERRKIQTTQLWLGRAINDLRGECENISSLTPIGQGIHHFGLPPRLRQEGYVYVVNGNKTFRGQRDQGTNLMEWVEIDNATDKKMLFKLDLNFQWGHIEDVSDLYSANSVDLHQVFDSIKTMLDGWKFDDHANTVEFLASYIMAAPVCAAIGNVNLLYVTGEPESGKTSLLKGLLGGTRNEGHDITPILEACRFSSDSTAAAMHQKMDRSTLLYIVDEAESTKSGDMTQHNRRVNEMMTHMLSLPMGGVSIDRGGQTAGQATDYHIRMPVLMGGVNMPEDKIFLTRLHIVYTKKDPGRRPLDDYIADYFDFEKIEQLRKNITVGLLPHIVELTHLRTELRARLSKATSEAHVSGRFLDTLLSALVVYEFLGKDAEKLYRELLEYNMPRLMSIHNTEDVSELINACLYKEAVKYNPEEGLTDYLDPRTLILRGEYQTLNNSNCGVYYLVEKSWIVIVWRQAKYSVLQQSQFGHLEEPSLKERANRNALVVHDISNADHTYIRETLGLTDIKSTSGYTVVKDSYLGLVDMVRKVSGPSKQEETTEGNQDVITSQEECYEIDALL